MSKPVVKRNASRAEGNLRSLPGVGPRMAVALRKVGIHVPGDLVGKDPWELYERLAAAAPEFADPCVLYVFRCAVWAAENPDDPDPYLRKWWNWKSRFAKRERRS